ncbi:MAG: DHA2 family efflux MFS transporter permease subunit [Kibdelosporangium sp.]
MTLREGSLVPLAATLLVGAVAALLDMTIVAVGIDVLQHEMRASVATIQWVTTAYVLAMTTVIPLVGWSVGRFGARAMWLTSLTLFLLGSVLCGLAWSAESLIAFRVVQGFGGGMILPLNQLVMARAAGPDRLGRVMSVGGLVGQLAPITGPVLGGLLIDTLGWQWIFFLNVPLVLISLAMTLRWFPADGERADQPLDSVGLVLLPTAVVALLYSLEGDHPGALPALVTGLVLLTVFVARTLRRGTGLIDLTLFANRSFRGGAVMMFVLGVTTWGPMFLLPLYYQQAQGLSAGDTGLLLALQSIGLASALPFTGRLVDRLAPRPLAATGLAIAVAGTVPFALGADEVLLGAALVVRGVGFGLGSLPIMVTIYRSVPSPSIPDATSAANVIQRIGAATGTALMALILQSGGFAPALVWMLVFTGIALTATVLLPGHRAERL